MAQKKLKKANHASKPGEVLLLYQLQSPEITRTIEGLYARYGKYAVPAAELRKMLDKEMGQRTLTEELYVMREER